MDQEIWKPIYQHEKEYEISNLGRIRSLLWQGNKKGNGLLKIRTTRYRKFVILNPRYNRGSKTFDITKNLPKYFPND